MAAEGNITGKISNAAISGADRPFGLKSYHGGYTLPLEKVVISATILQDFCCEVTVEQTFRMPSWNIMRNVIKGPEAAAPAEETIAEKVKFLVKEMDLPAEYIIKMFEEEDVDVEEILKDLNLGERGESGTNIWEAKYNFPLPPKSAIFHFEAQLDDGARVIGLVKQKNEAKRIYHEAVKNHKKAFLMEQKMADVFEMSVGNIYPKESSKITLKYVCELDVISNAIQLTFPMHLTPRYGASDYSATTVTYPVFFNIDIHTNSPIQNINLPDEFKSVCTRQDAVGGDARNTKLQIRINEWGVQLGNNDADKDFFFSIEQQECPPVSAMLERSLDFQTEVLRLSIRKNTIQNWIPDKDENDKFEILFVVDRSGSMRGKRIEQAKSAIQLLLRSLPEYCYFQLISYARDVANCFNELSKYNEQSFKEADDWITQINPSGGTDILSALEAAYRYPRVNANYTRKIILLTDGDVRNVDECINFVKAHNNQLVQVHTLGVGGDFNEGLCRGIADAGKGQFEGVRQESDINAAVIRLLEACVSILLTNPIFDLGAWGNTNNIIQVPRNFKYLPIRQRTNIYFVKRLNGGEFGSEGEDGASAILPTHTTMNGEGEKEVSEIQEILAPNLPEEGVAHLPDVEEFTAGLRASLTGEPEEIAVIHVNVSPVSMEGKADVERTEGNLVHRLMAKARLDEIVNRESMIQNAKARMTKIGERYNLVSSETSFVAVYEKEGKQHDIPINVAKKKKAKKEGTYASFHSFAPRSRMSSGGAAPKMRSANVVSDLGGQMNAALFNSSMESGVAGEVNSFFNGMKPMAAGGVADQAQPKADGPNILINIYDKTAEAKVWTVAAQHRKKRRKVLKMKMKELNLGKKEIFQCDKTMWCIPKSDSSEVNNWKFGGKTKAVEEYLAWLPDPNSKNNDGGTQNSKINEESKQPVKPAAKKNLETSRPPPVQNSAPSVPLDFDQLIKSQQFNGCFEIDLTPPNLSALVNELNKHGLNENVVKTILALYILKSVYAAKEDEWIFVAKKATKFLQKQKISFNFEEWIKFHLGSN